MPNPVIGRWSKPVQLFVGAVPSMNTVVALALTVGLRDPQETVKHIARVYVRSGDRSSGVVAKWIRALPGACARTWNIERRESTVLSTLIAVKHTV